MTRKRLLEVVVLLVLVGLLWWFNSQGNDPVEPTSDRTPAASATPEPGQDDAGSGLARVAVSDLPVEARETLALIDAGGPYPHDEDDDVFENREEILPDRPRGHYREYTVETPGLDHRGARRIVAGADGELYWTDDHYESFRRIVR